MEEIIRFVMLAQSARFTVSELCEQFGISRKTGYKYLDRYAAEGMKGLAARSHRPHQFPQRTAAAVRTGVIGNKRTGVMGYTSRQYVLEDCKPYGRDYSFCDVGAACAIYGERTVRAVRDQSQDWI